MYSIIAGIQISDNVESMVQKLKNAGYLPDQKNTNSVDGIIKGPSFDQLIKIARKELSYRDANDSIEQLRYIKGEETITVMFRPYPDGTAPESIHYNNFSPAITIENITPKAVSKYGEPASRKSNILTWSDKPLENASCGQKHPTAICMTLTELRNSKKSVMFSLSGGKNAPINPVKEARKIVQKKAPDTTF